MRRGAFRPALAGVMIVVASGFLGCGRPEPKPEPATEVPVAAPSFATDPEPGTSLVIRVKARRLDLMRDDTTTPIATFPIAVGRTGHETPTGRFHVEEKIEHPDYQKLDPKDRSRVLKYFPPGPANPLGERWIGFAHGDDWTVGIHGTPNPELLGQAVSGGCIRMRNADVLRVYDAVKVGTPVIVRP
jgi:lipoprotein-anchoring transpeptidase ErfK/SrfK